MSHPPLILVTGATDGIGRETALELTRRGARVLVHGRSADKTSRIAAELARLGPTPEPIVADFSDLGEVRAMGAELARRGEPLDVLLNNAGVYLKHREVSADGFELTLAVNHLAPFLLTHLCLPLLAAAPWGRIVNVASVAHQRGTIELSDLDWTRRSYSAYGAYAASKLANVLFTVELARRLGDPPPTVSCLHPGVVSTKLLTQGFEMQGPDSLAQGAATSVFCALNPQAATPSGAYYVKRRAVTPAPAARDLTLARALYEDTARRVGVTPL